MIKGILNFFGGFCMVTVRREHVTEALNALRVGEYAHWKMKQSADGAVSFFMLLRDTDAFRARVPMAVTGRGRGFPAILHRYHGRYGILLGALLFALLVWQSCTVVWEVQVTGNQRLSQEQVVKMLSDYGFGVGTRFGKMDFDVFQNEFLLTTDEIAFIAVNMEGTVAKVEIRENHGNHPKEEKTTPANIVAGEDGQIDEVRVTGGRAAVVKGDIVQKGDLLISGILSVREETVRYEYGSGEVLALVNRVISVESPVQRTQMSLTGTEIVRKTVRIFDKEVKLFGNSGIDYANYDTIVSSMQITLPGGIALPLWVDTVIVRETTEESVTVSETRAMADAFIEYRKEIDELLKEGEILSIETEHGMKDGAYCIVARAVCRVNIAKTAEIRME